LEGAKQGIVYAHHRTGIVELSAIVRCREQRHQLSFREELVAILHNLMSSTDEVHVVFLQEPGNDVRSKSEGNSSIVLAPAGDVLVRIRPQEITEKTRIRNIRRSHDTSDLLHALEVRTQTSMHSKDFLVDDSGDRQAVEAVGKGLPQLDVIATFALIVEAIDTIDRRAFVIAAEDEKVFGIFDLVGEQEADGFERLFTTIDVVTKEEIVGFWGESAIFEKSKEIVVLSMDITAYLDGRLEFKKDGLADENFAGFCTKVFDLVLLQLYWFAWSVSTDF